MLNSPESNRTALVIACLTLTLGCGPGGEPAQTSIDLLSFVGSDLNTNQVISLLNAGADPNVRFGWPASTPLHIAVATDSKGIAKLLVGAGATNGIKDSNGQAAFDLLKGRHATADELKEWERILELPR